MPALIAAAFLCLMPVQIDGDTMICQDKTRVRLWGVDSPERYTPEGPAATRALSNLITGQTLTCEPKGRSYNRTVALCRLPDGRDIAAEMVRQGQAKDWPEFSKGFYSIPGQAAPSKLGARAPRN